MQDVPQERGDADAQPSGKLTARVRFAGLVLDLDACTLARELGEAIPLTRNESGSFAPLCLIDRAVRRAAM